MDLMSMTGFGAATFELEGQRYRVECRSVNHRNLNVRFRLPPEFAPNEALLTRQVAERLGRGAVDLSVARESAASRGLDVHVDAAAAEALMKALRELAARLRIGEPDVGTILQYGDILEVRRPEPDREAAKEALVAGVARALDELVEARLAEGGLLADDLLARLDALERFLDAIEKQAPEVYARYEERLRKRVADAQAATEVTIDEGRLAAEFVIWSDKSDVTEETVRARTHIERFRQVLVGDEPERGKRLDFLAQELFREFNTIGSKCRDADMGNAVVDAKVELEKVREQAQNIA